MIISFLGQKGGAGKSTLARGLAVMGATEGNNIIIADMDPEQQTTYKWAQRRVEGGILPTITVATLDTVKEAFALEESADAVVIDGTPFASSLTSEIAAGSDWVVIPVGITRDDLEPALLLAEGLVESSVISRDRIIMVVVKVPDNGDKEAMATKRAITEWGFTPVDTWLPYRTSYGQAMDDGLAITETRFPRLNELAQRIFFQTGALIAQGDA